MPYRELGKPRTKRGGMRGRMSPLCTIEKGAIIENPWVKTAGILEVI